MPDLVAIALAPGPEFVTVLLEAWDRGDAVLPIDSRWPRSLREDIIDRFGASVVVGPDGSLRRDGFEVDPGDALVMATSGTSGDPKGVVLSHVALEAAARMTSEALEVNPRTDKWLACLPFSHIGGLGVWLRARLTATPVEIFPRVTAESLAAGVEAGCTLVSLVPTVLDRVEAASFRRILLGGSRMPSDRPSNTVTTYGLTESGGGVVYDAKPLPGAEVRIVDGVVHLRSPTMARAYRNGESVTTDGWLNTGDLGTFDGRLTITGRVDYQITTGGESVSPEPIEQRLAHHPAIAEVAVVGVQDPEWGQVVVAVVVPAERTDPPSLAELRQWVSDVRPGYEAPRRIVLVEELPRTSIGKLARGLLRTQID
jgi:O-succinylbenzoic acid--CoA ligase